ncbi:MAG: flavodoxin-dependent (E)-4-hydroxy-3-methylbut-2-enyl-diphosphate synthase [Phycisphaerae bacterium]
MPEIARRRTRRVPVGGAAIGGGAPVSVQSMTNTRTADAGATIAQVRLLAEAGADFVRVAVPTREDTAALPQIVKAAPVPIIADVHFHFDRALEAIDAGVAKIRLNPGNIKDRKQVRRVIAAAADAGTAIRVGVNEGSVVERADAAVRAADMARPLDELMEAKLAEYLEIFEEAKFGNLVLSAKSHDAFTTVAVYRRLAARWDYPLHLGVTHAGTRETGAIRSAAALGALLAEGIGDTIRISYAGDPVDEVRHGLELLWSLRLRPRRGIDLIACPTCGRIQMDIAPIAEAVRRELADLDAPITVAIMGCVVNGPGEAAGADVAICAGKGKAVLYRRGKKLRTVAEGDIVAAVVEEAKALAGRS